MNIYRIRKSITKILILFSIIQVFSPIFGVFLNKSYATAEDNDVYDVILFWGQSNMVGYCGVKKEEQKVDPRVKSSNYSTYTGINQEIINVIKTNNDPMNHVSVNIPSGCAYEYKSLQKGLSEINAETQYLGEPLLYRNNNGIIELEEVAQLKGNINSSVFSSQESYGTNMIPQFCKTYYEKTGHKVVAVMVANGGEPIANFLPSTDVNYGEKDKTDDNKQYIYEAMITKYKAAVSYLKNNDYIVGEKLYVCFQGEEDSSKNSTTTKDNYKETFLTIHNHLKEDLKTSSGAIIETARVLGSGETIYNNMVRINDAQKELVDESDDIILGSSYPWDNFIPSRGCYNKINNTSISENEYNTLFEKASYSRCSNGDGTINGIHLTSAGLSQIGLETAEALSKVTNSKEAIYLKSAISIDLTTDNKTNQLTAVTQNTSKKVAWTSSDTEIATVDSRGKVTAKKIGYANITAKLKGTSIKAVCKVKVIDKGIDIKSYSDVNGYSKIEIPVANNTDYTSGQGMAKIEANIKKSNGTTEKQSFIISAVIKNSGNSTRNQSATSIYILNTNGTIAAHLRNYKFGHANSICADNKYIYIASGDKVEKDEENNVIYSARKIYRLLKDDYVNKAIEEYNKVKNNKKNKWVTTKFTTNDNNENIITEYNSDKTIGSLLYDSDIRKKLYMTNNPNIYEIKRNRDGEFIDKEGNIIENNGTLYMEQLTSFPITKEQIGDNNKANGSNAGVAINGNYLFAGRFFKDGFNKNKNIKNVIYIYKMDYNLTKLTYLGTYLFNGGTLQQGELEDLTMYDNSLAVHYNMGNRQNNFICKIYIPGFNLRKVKIKFNGKAVGKGDVTAELYNQDNELIGTYKTSESGNIWIHNIKTNNEEYKLIIKNTKSDYKALKGATLVLKFEEYNYKYTPYAENTIEYKNNQIITN